MKMKWASAAAAADVAACVHVCINGVSVYEAPPPPLIRCKECQTAKRSGGANKAWIKKTQHPSSGLPPEASKQL